MAIETNAIHVVADGNDTSTREEKSVVTTLVGTIQIEYADALTRYKQWLAPTVIVSDGPYGLGLFPGDPPTPHKLAEWYEPHIVAWSAAALPETTLWFWCNEIGWATVHPVLEKYGWRYRALHVWDKGIAHVAGNVNSKTIRRFPVVTEVCVQYTREVCLSTGDGKLLPIQAWLRYEWQRAGIPLNRTNEACGVKNAATRKYFTQDHLWYFPPPDMMEKIVSYANLNGDVEGRPYFPLEGETATIAEKWERMRAKWKHTHGVTNVWAEPANRGEERVKNHNSKYVHANQKPLKLIKRIIEASSDPVDVIWEPFGGLCPAAVVALRTNRVCYSAEMNFEYYQLAQKRLLQERARMDQVPSPTLWDEEVI